jgi:hypothetical protein
MAIVLKVKWIEKSDQTDPCQRISHIGGEAGQMSWKHSHAQAIQAIEQDQFAYYIEKEARAVKLEIGLAPDGIKYLKAPADGDQPRFLLNLPERPQSAPPQFSERE